MKNKFNLGIIGMILLGLAVGCGGDKTDTAKPTNVATAPPNVAAATAPSPVEKPIAISAKALTQEYDDNELAADGKYKGKQIAVTGKISNIAETFGQVTVQLEGHNIVNTVLCSFEDAEKESVAKLKKGSQVTLVGRGDGKTSGLYAGLEKCRVQ